MPTGLTLRVARPGDYDAIVRAVDGWWGRQVSSSLPRLFLDHFWSTSRVAEDEQGLAGFLLAFVSPSEPQVGYVHFVGVRPDQRRRGLARMLYREFAGHALEQGCTEVRAVTAPVNKASVRFDERIGFTTSGPVPDYNGPGRPMFTFSLRLDEAARPD